MLYKYQIMHMTILMFNNATIHKKRGVNEF